MAVNMPSDLAESIQPHQPSSMNDIVQNRVHQQMSTHGIEVAGDSSETVANYEDTSNEHLNSTTALNGSRDEHQNTAEDDDVLLDNPGRAANTGPEEVPGNTTNEIERADIDDTSSEDSSVLMSDVGRHNRNLGMSLPLLEERHRMARKKVMQHQLYMRLVEDRLASLELAMSRKEEQQEYRRDNSNDRSRPASPDRFRQSLAADSIIVDQPTLVESIARIPMASFRPPQPKARKDNDDLDSSDDELHPSADPLHEPWHVIEVATTAPALHWASGRRRARSRQPSIASAEYEERIDFTIDLDLLTRVPERVRIRSIVLLKTLEKITEGKFTIPKPEKVYIRKTTRRGHANNAPPHQPMVFLRPYKLFMEFAEMIRTYTEELQTRIGAESRAGEVTPIVTVQSEEDSSPPVEDVTVSKIALRHLRILVDLFDFDLKGLFELRRQIKDGDLKTIAFADLWHLFSHGEEVCSGSDSAQMYRVFQYTGGRKYLSNLQRQEDNVEKRPKYEERRGSVPREYYEDTQDSLYLTRSRTGSDFVVQCFSFDFNGVEYGPTQTTFRISPYDGDVSINSLVIFPHRFRNVKSHGHVQVVKSMPSKQELVERGKRFVDLSKVRHKSYKGTTVDTGDEVDSQVIIDFALGLQQNRDMWHIDLGMRQPIDADVRETREESNWTNTNFRDAPCMIRGCCNNDFIHADDELDLTRARDMFTEQEDILVRFYDPDVLTDEDLMLFPTRVVGFILRDRTWAMLNIDQVIDVQPLDSGLDALCLPKGHKDSLLALVRNHSRGTASSSEGKPDDQTQFDLIPGKGKGLIVLLHGAPGVGKTSTAESIAAHTNRPLFPITCGDIGETADQVDRKLRSTFQLAHKWGCVLLLDEADVFLQRRNKTDLQRNSIVSVFLRVLEYYSGILFLTTNRIGTIDPAFKSRIHMSLYYPALDEDATREIWKWHILNVVKNKKDMTVDKKEIFKFALTHFAELDRERAVWNGRQIRNAFQTAVALAEYDAFKIKEKYKVAEQPHLRAEHFEQVARASKDFDKYLQAVWGGYSDADLARRAQERVVNPHDSRGGERAGGRSGPPGVGGSRIPSSPVPRVRRDDDFQDDDDDWDEPDEKLPRPPEEDDEDWTDQRAVGARGKIGEGKKGSRGERK